MGSSYLAAIDQGTTSTRFIVYDTAAKVVASHQLEFTQIYPQAGSSFSTFSSPLPFCASACTTGNSVHNSFRGIMSLVL